MKRLRTQALNITLRGITNSVQDPSVDTWRGVTLPLLRKVVGAEDNFQMKIVRRGAPPKVRNSTRLPYRSDAQASFTCSGMATLMSGSLAGHALRDMTPLWTWYRVEGRCS